MTNLDSSQIEEIMYADEIGLTPGYIRSYTLPNNKCEFIQYQTVNHEKHRLLGPAIECQCDGQPHNEWYFMGKKIKCKSQEEYKRYIDRILKMKVFW